MGWILNWGGQEGGINGLRNMVSTAGIHTQGARKMPIGVFFSASPPFSVSFFGLKNPARVWEGGPPSCIFIGVTGGKIWVFSDSYSYIRTH